MSKYILGLDLGTNSIGWALLEEDESQPKKIIDLGSRIFIKAVEEKTPTPKNAKRRDARLTRRVIQRRARRKKRMLNYLVKLGLLPAELAGHPQPEIILNTLGDPYHLRKKALDERLENHELGRVLLHLVQRRGFLSNRKTLLDREMLDDPDVQAVLVEQEEVEDNLSERAKEETAFKDAIKKLRTMIKNTDCRTLGEYLATRGDHECKRNRSREGGYLRTDRQMYRDELDLIWQEQAKHHAQLNGDVKEQIEEIIFYQRPLKLRADRIGKCSLEPSRKRANMARLEAQHFRYLQDINSIRYSDPVEEKERVFDAAQRKELTGLFEHEPAPTFTKIKKRLNLHKKTDFNLENDTKKLKGNLTACKIRKVLEDWDKLDADRQYALVEDLITIKKKSVLKKRLTTHWGFDIETAVGLCLLEFEPGHANLSVKAINRLLPFLEKGEIYSEARISAGYGYEIKAEDVTDRLGPSPDLPNPIVKKALSELKRLVNALIAEYGKPDAIRIEMARDLEMNTKRHQAYLKQQKANTKANEDAVNAYQVMVEKNPHLRLSRYPDRADKIRYRLWKDQKERCAYSGKTIPLSALFSAEVDVDHILPYSQSLDDSYMNKVICYARENRNKGQRTPINAFGGHTEKWEQITQAIRRWDKKLSAKKNRFFTTEEELQKRDFINSQLNDTRYISREAQGYVKQLGVDVSVSKGHITAWLRHQWGLNNLIGDSPEKDRSDHRHHAIDAVVIACVDRSFYQKLVRKAKMLEASQIGSGIKNIEIEVPWPELRTALQNKLKDVIVAHTPQRKLSDELHENTGSGFIEGQGTVYRKLLGDYFDKCKTEKEARKKLSGIVDPCVSEILENHLAKYEFDTKKAFASGRMVYHKNGLTPIKRIRVFQSQVIKKRVQLEKEKFAVKDKQGKIFKWFSYGNVHHIEVIKDQSNGKCHGVFVTMMEAAQRVKGIKGPKQPMIKIDHGETFDFVLALHKNDLVSIELNGERGFYQIKSLGQLSQGTQPRPTLLLHTNSDGKVGAISDSIKNLMERYRLKLHKINAIGKFIE